MYINPYQNITDQDTDWLKSNFHTHAGTGMETCGENEIKPVVDMYKQAGYDVLAISNHDLFSDVKYLEDEFDIVMINSFEYTTDPHMLCINTSKAYLDDHQTAIDKTRRESGFVILCHPNWQKNGYWPLESIESIKGYSGIEIYNAVIKRLWGSCLATDVWDQLLSSGKLVWGFASDDFHKWFDLARSWTQILSKSKSQGDILDSIEKGAICASTGLVLDSFTFDGSKLIVSASEPKLIEKESLRYNFIGKDGCLLHEQYGSIAEYALNGDELYVRVKAEAEDGSMLWTQPLYKEGAFRRP